MEQLSASPKPRRFYLFSHPRTRSNLFIKLFEAHPDLCILRCRFQVAYLYGPESQKTRASVLPENENLGWYKDETYQVAYDKMMTRIKELAEDNGKSVFLKDHTWTVMTPKAISDAMGTAAEAEGAKGTELEALFKEQQESRRAGKIPVIYPGEQIAVPVYSSAIISPLILPNEFLSGIIPIIMIRHPLYFINSYYNVAPGAIGADIGDKDFPLAASLSLSRKLYEYFASRDGPDPIVVDGDDIVRDPKRLAEAFCNVASLEPSGVQYEWEAATEEALARVQSGHRLFTETLLTSTKVEQKHIPESPNFDDMEQKWAAQHGKDVAGRLRMFAEAAMADYRFLASKKI